MHATLDNLPADVTHFYVYVTATRINFDEADDGVAETGWVDPTWSLSTLEESSNYVSPAAVAHSIDVDPDDEDLDTWEKVILDAWDDARRSIPSTVTGNHDGTYYADDAVTLDYRTADTYAYALHAELVGPMGPTGARVYGLVGLPTD